MWIIKIITKEQKLTKIVWSSKEDFERSNQRFRRFIIVLHWPREKIEATDHVQRQMPWEMGGESCHSSWSKYSS